MVGRGRSNRARLLERPVLYDQDACREVPQPSQPNMRKDGFVLTLLEEQLER